MPRKSLSLSFQAKLKHHLSFFINHYYYLKITCTRHHNEIGRTEITHSLQPSWITTIVFDDYIPNINQYITVELFNISSSDYLLGSSQFHLQESLKKTSNGQTQEEILDSNRGSILLFTEQYFENNATISIQLRCVNVKRIQRLLMMTRCNPFFIIYKKRFYPLIGTTRWQPIYRSNHIKNHHHPLWKEFTIGLNQFCDDEKDRYNVKIELHNYQKNGNHRFIGELETSLNMLQKCVTNNGNADLKKSIDFCDRRKNKRGISVAQMVVLNCEINNEI